MPSTASHLVNLAREMADANIIIRLYDTGHPIRDEFESLNVRAQRLLALTPQWVLRTAIALADYNSDEVKILEAERDRRLANGEWK